MKRIGLVVAYDGTNYCGWQTQPNGITVQGVLNDTLSELLGEKIETIGASRTDAGVHALGNVAVFDTNTRIPGEKISVCAEPAASGGHPDSDVRRSGTGFPPEILRQRENLRIPYSEPQIPGSYRAPVFLFLSL